MYAIEMWTRDPDTGHMHYDVVNAKRIRITKIDEDGAVQILVGTSDWDEE